MCWYEQLLDNNPSRLLGSPHSGFLCVGNTVTRERAHESSPLRNVFLAAACAGATDSIFRGVVSSATKASEIAVPYCLNRQSSCVCGPKGLHMSTDHVGTFLMESCGQPIAMAAPAVKLVMHIEWAEMVLMLGGSIRNFLSSLPG